MRKFYLLLLSITIFTSSNAQSVNVIATSGTLIGSYPTLKGAFNRINIARHSPHAIYQPEVTRPDATTINITVIY